MENISVHPSRKSRKPHSTDGSESVKRRNSTPKPATARESCKPEGPQKRKNSSEGGRRPSTVSGPFRKRTNSFEKERSPSMPTSASFSTKGGSSPMRERNPTRVKAKPPPKNQLEESAKGPALLLPKAILEQEKLMKVFGEVREELRGMMVEKMKSGGRTDSKGDFAPLEPPNSTKFETSYSGTLDEIFQAWANLFYFIINLKVNLLRLLDAPGTEPFTPNLDAETEVVGQATECVKLFSQLKMKSLVNSLDDLCLPDDHNIDETRIREFEERISSPFLTEMDFIQKKSQELVELLTEKNSKCISGEEKRGRSELVSQEEGQVHKIDDK